MWERDPPRASRMVILTWVTLGPPSPPEGEQEHLLFSPSEGGGKRGQEGHGGGETCPQAQETSCHLSQSASPSVPCAVEGLRDPRRMEQLGGVGGVGNPVS